MTLTPILLAFGLLTQPALAKKKGKKKDDGVGLRLKLSTDLMALQTTQLNVDGSDVDNGDTRVTTIGLFDSSGVTGRGPRFEGTYTFMKNVEAGLILGYSQARGTAGDAEIPLARHSQIGLTGAYNYGLGNGLQAFGQPILMMDTTTTGVGEETETRLRTNVVGADVGVRWKAAKRVTLDLAFEGLVGRTRATVNGESDDDVFEKYRSFGLRTGLSVRL